MTGVFVSSLCHLFSPVRSTCCEWLTAFGIAFFAYLLLLEPGTFLDLPQAFRRKLLDDFDEFAADQTLGPADQEWRRIGRLGLLDESANGFKRATGIVATHQLTGPGRKREPARG